MGGGLRELGAEARAAPGRGVGLAPGRGGLRLQGAHLAAGHTEGHRSHLPARHVLQALVRAECNTATANCTQHPGRWRLGKMSAKLIDQINKLRGPALRTRVVVIAVVFSYREVLPTLARSMLLRVRVVPAMAPAAAAPQSTTCSSPATAARTSPAATIITATSSVAQAAATTTTMRGPWSAAATTCAEAAVAETLLSVLARLQRPIVVSSFRGEPRVGSRKFVLILGTQVRPGRPIRWPATADALLRSGACRLRSADCTRHPATERARTRMR